MAGISRVHGTAASPKNFAGVSLADFTLSLWNGDCYVLAADQALAGGALDQVFRTAVGTVGTVSRVGTLTTGTALSGANYVRFAVEVLGADADSTGYLGMGTGNGAGSDPDSTAAAIEAAVQALGSITNSAGSVIHLTSATVAAFTY